MDIELCRNLFSSGRYRTLLCGFSGGADSTAALLLADMFSKEYGFDLVAIHFNHHLRAEADREAQEAESFAKQRDIPFVKIDLDLGDTSAGVENAARAARLAEWKRLAAAYPGSAVILGHHADDKIENLFIRLFRGSNSSGLSGLREANTVDKVVFLRPLLNFRRSEIEKFLKENGVTNWTTDSSNLESVYFRNYLRNDLIPQLVERLPFAVKGLLRSAEAIACDADFIEEKTREIWQAGDPGDRNFWLTLHDAVAFRALRKFISEKSGCDTPVSGALFERFKNEIARFSTEGRIIPVDNIIQLIVQGDRVDAVLPAPETLLWDWKNTPGVQYGDILFSRSYTGSPDCESVDAASFDADLLDQVLEISPPRPGEKFLPFGRDKVVGIKKLRTDRKIPSYLNTPALRLSDGTAVWLPFIRNGNLCKVTPETRKIVTFYAKRV